MMLKIQLCITGINDFKIYRIFLYLIAIIFHNTVLLYQINTAVVSIRDYQKQLPSPKC